MNSNESESWESLSANDILLTDWMITDNDSSYSNDDEHEQMDVVVHDNREWKPLRPYIIPLLKNHVVHIKRRSNGAVVSGPLLTFDTDRNGYSYIIILDQVTNDSHKRILCTALIESVYIDYTLVTNRNLRSVYEILLRKLNSDVAYEISSYLHTDYLYV